MEEGPHRRRGIITALLTPPIVTLSKTPTAQEGVQTMALPTNHHLHDADMKERTCRLCHCKEPCKDDAEEELIYTYDLALVRKTLTAEMDQCGLDLQEDCTFCPFCLEKLQGLVQLRRQMDRLQERLTSMTTGLMTLLSPSSSTPSPKGAEEEECLVSVKEEVEEEEEDAEAMYILTCATEEGGDPGESQDPRVPHTEAEDISSEGHPRHDDEEPGTSTSSHHLPDIGPDPDPMSMYPIPSVTFNMNAFIKGVQMKVNYDIANTNKEGEGYKCAYCGKKYTKANRSAWYKHVKRMHADRIELTYTASTTSKDFTVLKCDLCSFTTCNGLSGERNLQLHKERHRQKPKIRPSHPASTIKCLFCPMLFSHKSNMKRHAKGCCYKPA